MRSTCIKYEYQKSCHAQRRLNQLCVTPKVRTETMSRCARDTHSNSIWGKGKNLLTGMPKDKTGCFRWQWFPIRGKMLNRAQVPLRRDSQSPSGSGSFFPNLRVDGSIPYLLGNSHPFTYSEDIKTITPRSTEVSTARRECRTTQEQSFLQILSWVS